MKIIKFNTKFMIFATVVATSLLMTSCSDWLSVAPSTQKSADEMFENEGGFKTTLTGVYTLMSAPELYGRELTFGTLDFLGQYWKKPETDYQRYVNVYQYKFEESGVVKIIDDIWKKQFNVIANINNILSYVDKNKNVFYSTENYHLVKGEALGLRAFLHLDMLRLYSPADFASEEKWLPYVDEYTRSTKESRTNKEFIAKMITDLENAIVLLEEDPLYKGTEAKDIYFKNRNYHFNYYAACATLARAYLYSGNKSKAAEYAEIVINAQQNSGLFRWITVNEVTFATKAHRDRTFSTEHIFALNIPKLKDHIKGYFTSVTPASVMTMERTVNTVYENAIEYRTNFFETESTIPDVPSKLWQLDSESGATLEQKKERMPLIRISEMYYIMAECKEDITYLDQVRNNRGLEVLASDADLQVEIDKEITKEFVGEGQRFYHYKRLGKNSIDRSVPSWVVPMPETEINFGDRPRPN